LRGLAASAVLRAMAPDPSQTDVVVRDATQGDWPAVLALNTAWVHYLSPMDRARLGKLAAAACDFRVAGRDGQVDAFLLSFRKGADYDGAIFRLLSERADDFVYVDRIVVDESRRKSGLARRLYDDVIARAREAGAATVVCEVNVDPPNPGSLRFHEAYGFREIGRHCTEDGKTVALLALDL
jgi:predicted GNAT superfamily acetyltransferase